MLTHPDDDINDAKVRDGGGNARADPRILDLGPKQRALGILGDFLPEVPDGFLVNFEGSAHMLVVDGNQVGSFCRENLAGLSWSNIVVRLHEIPQPPGVAISVKQFRV